MTTPSPAAHEPLGATPTLGSPQDDVQGTVMSANEGAEERVLRFSDGIPGFAAAHQFVLSDLTDDGTFQLLASVEDTELSLVVTYPWLFFPDYTPELPAEDQRVLGIDTPEDALVFCTVVVDDDDDRLHLNLRAPFVVNAATRAARQVILDDADHPLRAAVPTAG